jgi:hypothetical protein
MTLFSHAHIVDGVTIVHSHPYKSGSGKNPVNHQHTSNGFLLIHFISNILTTISFLAISIGAYKAVLRKSDFGKLEENFYDLSVLYSYTLRAPPFKYTR